MKRKTELVDSVLGESFDEDVVPQYPGRIFYHENRGFTTGYPYAPVIVTEVRFRQARHNEDGDFTVCAARWVDTTSPENPSGDWVRG